MNTHKFFGELEEMTYTEVKFSGTEVDAVLCNATKMDSTLLDKLASFCEDSAEIEKNSREALTLALKAEPNFIVDFLHNDVEEVSSEALADFMERCVEGGEDIPPEEFAQALQLKKIEFTLPYPVCNDDHGTDSMIDFDVKNEKSVIMLSYDLDGVMWEGGVFVYFNIDGEAIKVYYVQEW